MSEFVKVACVGDIEPGTGKTVNLEGIPVALFNVNGEYFAIHNTCPHEDGPLGEGTLCGSVVTCPTHAYEFDVISGECLTEPAYSVEQFEVRVDGDDILVRQAAGDGFL
jgi:nitrite reductase/ring-hydroxylating ferredoxin subunit